jgi:acyl-coenzyme A thioesterase PaaI-like protein
MQLNTHLAISPDWVGQVVELACGRARARLTASSGMTADDQGLVHGGFTFGLADYACMLAINDPHVVLGGAEVRFMAPVRCGEVMEAEAEVEAGEGKKKMVRCRVVVGERLVFEGTFTCFVLERHILDD